MNNLIDRLQELLNQIDNLMQQLQIDEKADKVDDLEKEAAAPDFWDDSDTAQKKMQRLSRLKNQVAKWRDVHARISDALELAQLEEDDLLDELNSEADKLAKLVDTLSLEAMLSGEYDDEDAIMSIHAGAGGTEAQDWASMLERMYLRWMEQNGYQYEIIDRSYGEEAGIKSVTIAVRGDNAFGYLQSESGVHRLVRISPYDASSRRHTSFAKVELYPDIGDDIEVEIKNEDIRFDVFRASGPGGQSVNTTDSAVRVTHTPTGIVVSSQNQKSQHQNREQAMKVLKARLFELERRKKEEEIAELKGENVAAGWGNQIRSYVMHPYQMVKDHRTNHETGNVSSVMDGSLNEFMEVYLRSQVGEGESQSSSE